MEAQILYQFVHIHELFGNKTVLLILTPTPIVTVVYVLVGVELSAEKVITQFKVFLAESILCIGCWNCDMRWYEINSCHVSGVCLMTLIRPWPDGSALLAIFYT